MTNRTKAGQGTESARLVRVVGVPGAVLMGLGSILGTGIFVSLGIAAGIAGPSVIVAVALAALVATFNGLSSAQLAASHPVSGGTYEYGYRYLNPTLGFTAGWMFLCAKSASAATAALGFAGYLLVAAGASAATYRTALALLAVVALTLIVAGGITRSSRANTLIVALTLLSLGAFVVFGLPSAIAGASKHVAPLSLGQSSGGDAATFLRATALMFVAFTGYGRIATLGEEVSNPRRSIPRAIIVTLGVTALIYMLVAFVAVASKGADALSEATSEKAAPLEIIARGFALPHSWSTGVSWAVAIGAVTAMLGVLLNLILGLSRVVLAMGRRSDMPSLFARVNEKSSSPVGAVLLVGAIIFGLVTIGDVRTTWSFSAFTVLVYYALTNLAALRIPADERLYPSWISVVGLLFCLGLAFWVEPAIWSAGIALIALGLVWHTVARHIARTKM